MKGELFEVSFKPLKVVLKKPLHKAPDIYEVKHQVKRCLLEIKEWADRDIVLPWSGGFDGAFTVLCFLDLVDEGKLPIDAFLIKGACFQSKGINVSSDWVRGVKFLKEIQRSGMRIDLQDIELNKVFMKKVISMCLQFDQMKFPWATQEVWRRDQDEICLIHMGFPFPTYREDVLVAFNTFNFCECREESSSVNIYHWDEHIFSSFFTDFLLEVPYVEYDEKVHYNEKLWNHVFLTQTHKMIYFLMCYPILMKLFLKNPTVKPELIEDTGVKELWKEAQGGYQPVLDVRLSEHGHFLRDHIDLVPEYGFCDMIFQNGEVVKSLEQTQEFFNRQT